MKNTPLLLLTLIFSLLIVPTTYAASGGDGDLKISDSYDKDKAEAEAKARIKDKAAAEAKARIKDKAAAEAKAKAESVATAKAAEVKAKAAAEAVAETQTQAKLVEGKAELKVDIKQNDESGDSDFNDISFSYTAMELWQNSEIEFEYNLNAETGGATLTNRMIISNPALTQPTTVSVPDIDDGPGSGTTAVGNLFFPLIPCSPPGGFDVLGGTLCICNGEGWTCPPHNLR